MFGSEEIRQALNVEPITDLLDTFNTEPALFSDSKIPTAFEGISSINFYMATAANVSADVEIYNYTVNCRSDTYYKSRNIARVAIDNISRVSYGSFYITCSLSTTLKPLDERDNYNTILNITLKKR